MQDVILERQFEPGLTTEGFYALAAEGIKCMPLYRVQWQESLLALDGNRLVCRFKAPDTEAVRMVARDSHPKVKIAWSGAVHETGRDQAANVMVERRFAEPVTVEELQAKEDAAAWCLEQHQVTFLRTFFSADRRRMLCLYHAPDAESVRQAQRQAGMPLDRVWACSNFNRANVSLG